MDFRKIVAVWIAAEIAAFIAGNLIYLNPLTSELYYSEAVMGITYEKTK